MKILSTWVVYLFIILIFNSCGEPVPVACTPDEEECATEREGGFETGPVAGIAAGGAVVIALASGGLSSDDGGQSSSNSESTDGDVVSVGSSCNFAGGTVPNGGNVIAFRNDTVSAGETCASQTRTCNNGYLSGNYSFSTCNEAKPMACFFNNSTLQHADSITAYATASVLEGGICLSQTRTCQNGVLRGSYNFKGCEEQNECVFYIGDFNTANGIFHGQWYQRDSEGVPISGSSIFDDDADQSTIPSILADDGYVISGTQTITLVNGSAVSANIIRGPSGCGQIFMGENQGDQTYWTQQSGTASMDVAHGITSDSSDNIYVTGYTEGDLDGNTSAGGMDIIVVQYNSIGVKQWTRQLGTSYSEMGQGITSDSSGNVYVTGHTNGNLESQTDLVIGQSDLFVVKYNSSGVKQWTRQLGTSYDESGQGITSDSSGNIYVTGYTEGDLDDNTKAGGADLFVVKYSSSGVKQWTRQLGSSHSTATVRWDIVSDSSGNIYVTGGTHGGLDGNTNAGFGAYLGEDLFVVMYSSSGVKQWTRQLGTSYDDRGQGITTDSSGNVYVTGYTYGNLESQTDLTFGQNDLFVVKYNSSGAKQWTRQLGTVFSEQGLGITSDSSNNIYVTGYTGGGLDGNANVGSNVEGTDFTDFFVVKYNSNGAKQ